MFKLIICGVVFLSICSMITVVTGMQFQLIYYLFNKKKKKIAHKHITHLQHIQTYTPTINRWLWLVVMKYKTENLLH